ncbi:hypothetical protein [Myxococcus virescens]|uniref:Uncharacterized protein n=1 Tax=Myxococcus virescens TaxID=83456 RepID=A0A511HGU1_9BACT|nr:hypothetical protein [Myxococcus virescens]GEL72778.1 hypothetical protein MVI01_45620 [Myxococcus virescens]
MKEGHAGKVISGHRWSHAVLNDEQPAQAEHAHKASKLPVLADARA